jgi:hypothetical protein
MACISPRTRKADHAEGCGADRTRERDPLLTPQEAARYLGLQVQTLSVWRCHGRYSLKYLKVGAKVMYRQRDLDAWLASRTATSSAAGLPR